VDANEPTDNPVRAGTSRAEREAEHDRRTATDPEAAATPEENRPLNAWAMTDEVRESIMRLCMRPDLLMNVFRAQVEAMRPSEKRFLTLLCRDALTQAGAPALANLIPELEGVPERAGSMSRAQGFSPYGICSDLALVVRAVRALRLDRPELAENFATAASLILANLGFNDLAASIASGHAAQQDAEPAPEPVPAP